MRRIPLTQGKEALVNNRDYAYLMQWEWYYRKQPKGEGGYAARSNWQPRQLIFMHNVVAKRKGITCQPDHKNQNKLDNRRGNLRPATRSQNMGNCVLRKDNDAGYKGVSRHKTGNKWQSQIQLKGKKANFGLFPLTKLGKIQAAYAYTVAAAICFGDYAHFKPVDHLLDDPTKKRIRRDVLQCLKERFS